MATVVNPIDGLFNGEVNMADDIRIEIAISAGTASLATELPDNIRVYIRYYDIQDMDVDVKVDEDGNGYRLLEIFYLGRWP